MFYKSYLTFAPFFFSTSESAVSFDGTGYLKYLYQTEEEEEESQNFRLSLRIKTFQQQGVVMNTNATNWGSLKVM